MFTIDTNNFLISDMLDITNRSLSDGLDWVPIMDIGIGTKSQAAQKGEQLDIFIKSSVTSSNLIGNVWPGSAYFPDFNNPKTEQFWTEGLHNITTNYQGL